MHFRISHGADRDQRHVKGVEEGIMLDPYESQRAATDDQHNSTAQDDQPSAEAAHSVVILERPCVPKSGDRGENVETPGVGTIAGPRGRPGTQKCATIQRFRASNTVMSSDSSGTPVHCRTLSITLSIICASSRSAFFATNSISRSSPNISPYSFSGSVMPSV